MQEDGSFIQYCNNYKPGGDLIIDISRDCAEWENIRKQLEEQSIDCERIHLCLRS